MKNLCLLICIMLSNSIFSQDVSIATKFSENGTLFDGLNTSSKPLTQFKKNEKCIVIGYLGKDNYKVKYKEWVGFLNSDFLMINEEMMDLYYDYQEEERQKLIEERENRKKRLQAIIWNSAEEKAKRKKDSIEKANIAEEKAKRQHDSVAKVKEAERWRLAEKEFQRKQAALRELRVKDSITKAKEAEKQRVAVQELQLKQAEEKAKRQRDSVANTRQSEERRLATEALLLKQAEQKAKKLLDSIAKIKEIKKNNSEKSKTSNTCNYLINEYDEFYKEQLIRTEPYKLNKSLTVELYRQGNKINIFLNLSENLGCASYLTRNRSSVRILLENNQTIALFHSWNIDCENFNFKGRISNSQMQRLKRSAIKSIYFKGTKNAKKVTDIDYRTFFIEKLRCIE